MVQHLIVGDAIYFDASNSGAEPWVYDTSNQTVWMIEDLSPGLLWAPIFHDDSDCPAWGHHLFPSRGRYLLRNFAHQPARSIIRPTPVTWSPRKAINSTNCQRTTFSTTNGTVYGTPTELWPQNVPHGVRTTALAQVAYPTSPWGRTPNPLLFTEHAHPHQGQPEELVAECDADEAG